MQRMEEQEMHLYIKPPFMVSYNAQTCVEQCRTGTAVRLVYANTRVPSCLIFVL